MSRSDGEKENKEIKREKKQKELESTVLFC